MSCCMPSHLRPEGSPCPECGRPIERRASARTGDEILMRCRSCGWNAYWRRPGADPVNGTAAQTADDLAWLSGSGGERRACRVIDFGSLRRMR